MIEKFPFMLRFSKHSESFFKRMSMFNVGPGVDTLNLELPLSVQRIDVSRAIQLFE